MTKPTNGPFGQHVIARETGWTWRCAKPGSSFYAYRITWCPYNLTVTGDIGEIVISHYSFIDPWAAAAWINGAGWSYFMEKSNCGKEYDGEATAKSIVEDAYRRLRDFRDDVSLFECIVDEFGSYGDDANNPEDRKNACRAMLADGISAERAYDLTSDFEVCVMAYPEKHRIKYDALKLWAQWMWDNEPAWHKAVRAKRRVEAAWRDLKRYPPVFDPILYAAFRNGQVYAFNGATVWRWRKGGNGERFYEGMAPFKIAGKSLTRFGVWRVQGSSWSDRDFRFQPITARQAAEVAQ